MVGDQFSNLFRHKADPLCLKALVFYDKESQCYIAHCLELDLVANGDTPKSAANSLAGVIVAQLEFVAKHNSWEYFFRPAPSEIWAMYAKATAQDKTEGFFRREKWEKLSYPHRKFYNLHVMSANAEVSA